MPRMSSSTTRLVFVLIFVLNCILWSQSRYGQLHQFQSLTSPSLTKRYLVELGYVNGSNGFDDEGGKEVSKLSTLCYAFEAQKEYVP
jgi:hypothetical protein